VFDGALSILLSVLALTVAAAFVVAYFLANVRKAKDDVLRANNSDLEHRVALLEQDKTALEVQVKAQQKQIDVLRDLASGTTAIKEMDARLLGFFERHEQMADERYRMLIETQDRVAEAIGKFTEAVARSGHRRTDPPGAQHD
jgi:outer membrane murein-binding lipoprotein Lpp